MTVLSDIGEKFEKFGRALDKRYGVLGVVSLVLPLALLAAATIMAFIAITIYYSGLPLILLLFVVPYMWIRAALEMRANR